MNKGFYDNLDTNFAQALNMAEKNFQHNELIEMLKSGNIPQKLEIKAIVVMPYNANAETDFGGAELPIDNDSIKLGYIYRTDIQGNQKICI